MPVSPGYKYATWILAIVVVVLIVVIAVQPKSATDQFATAQKQLNQCAQKINAWRATAATSTTAQADLNNILASCQNDLSVASDAL